MVQGYLLGMMTGLTSKQFPDKTFDAFIVLLTAPCKVKKNDREEIAKVASGAESPLPLSREYMYGER